MCSLDLSAREFLIEVQMQPDEGKRQLDGFGVGIRRLRRKRVHDVLMDERRIAMREGVAEQFVVGLFWGHCTHPVRPIRTAASFLDLKVDLEMPTDAV